MIFGFVFASNSLGRGQRRLLKSSRFLPGHTAAHIKLTQHSPLFRELFEHQEETIELQFRAPPH